MENVSLKELNENIVRKGIIFVDGAHGSHAVLDGIYGWGFTVIHYSDVMDPSIYFYDTNYQFITSIYLDENVSYRVVNGKLDVKIQWLPGQKEHHYIYDLYKGAPIHRENVTALLYKDDLDLGSSMRVLFADVNNKQKVYYIIDGDGVQDITNTAKTVEWYLADGYNLITEEHYEDNINHFNDCLVMNPVLTAFGQ